jgi:hypothetical protein
MFGGLLAGGCVAHFQAPMGRISSFAVLSRAQLILNKALTNGSKRLSLDFKLKFRSQDENKGLLAA